MALSRTLPINRTITLDCNLREVNNDSEITFGLYFCFTVTNYASAGIPTFLGGRKYYYIDIFNAKILFISYNKSTD